MDMSQIWQNLLVPGVSVVEKIVRPIIVFFFLIIALRVFGRRELAQLSIGDLVVILLLSNTVQNAIIGEDNSLVGGLIGAITLLVTNNVTDQIITRNKWLKGWFEGKEIELIRDGKVDKAALKREDVEEDELKQTIRKQGLEDFNDVHLCILETDGNISVIPKDNMSRKHLQAQLDQILAQQQQILEKMSK